MFAMSPLVLLRNVKPFGVLSVLWCAGFNATSVGLVVTSVFQMTFQVHAASPFPAASLCIGLLAFGAVDLLHCFEPGVVLGGGVLGLLAWAAGCH
jgi:chromate transporter